MRCAVEGWSSALPEASLRLTASGDSARTSSSRIIRSMTWMEFLDSFSLMRGSQPAKFYLTIREQRGGVVR